MRPSFESLLCSEADNNFGDVDELEVVWNYRNCQRSNQNQSFDGFHPLLSDECLGVMVEKETQHLPGIHYLKRLQIGDLELGWRKEAFDWIGKVHAHFGFGPLCAYLSMNYLDRFLAAYEMPKDKPWAIQLLAVACLSLAAKMEETEVPLSLDLQVGEAEFVFESKTIQRMELLVLSTLKWRMQAVTPFSFIESFLQKLNGDQIHNRTCMLQQSIQLILGTIKEIEFMEFRPSEVAAAVAVYVGGYSEKTDFERAFCVLPQIVEKGKVVKCVEMIKDKEMEGVGGSPNGVLEAAWLSYKTPQAQPKRRRLDRTEL